MIPFILAAWFTCGILEIYAHTSWRYENLNLLQPMTLRYHFSPFYENNWQSYLFGPIALYVGERQRNHMRR